ncbi:MAG: hypothetical protein ABWZ30_01025 [Jiangellaceae bacterium]
MSTRTYPHTPAVGPREHALAGETTLYCKGHDGPHHIGLNMLPGGQEPRIAVHARQAMHHVVPASDWEPPDGPRDDAAQWQAWMELAATVLDRADLHRGPFVEVDDTEWQALVRCLADAAEYMNVNNYADDADFPEDAAAAGLFTTVHAGPGTAGLEICWKER